MSKWYWLIAVASVAAFSASAGEVGCPEGPTDYSYCAGHNFTEGNGYPYVEDIQSTGVIVGNTETTVMTTCATLPGDPTTDPTRRELRSTTAFHALLRAYIRIDSVSGAIPGARFHVRFLVDGIEVGGATRFIRMTPDSTAPLLPQGDELNATAHGLAAGNHLFEVKARMVDGGSMRVGLAWITAQGVPSSFPSGRSVISTSTTITASWAPITDTLHFTVPVGQTVDIFPQAYFQFQGGTPGDHISVGFGLKRRTDAQYAPSLRNPELSVKCPLKDANGQCFWPSVDPARDGINITDHFFDVGAGDWDLVLYAINRSGRTTTVAYRQIEFVAFPSSGGNKAGKVKASGEPGAIEQEYIGTPVTVSSTAGDADQPLHSESNVCGPWTKIAVLDVPASPAGSEENWVGGGYVEIVDRAGGDWTEPDIEVLVEATGPPNDFGQQIVSLGNGRHAIFFHIDAGRWGNTDGGDQDGIGNRLTLWVRKRVEADGNPDPSTGPSCAFTQGQFARTGTRRDASFTVGKRYMAVKLVPLGTCYHYNP